MRKDGSDRKLKLRVDSGACVSAVNPNHPAVRGYQTHKDSATGRNYSTAATEKVVDLGKRVLQTKDKGGPNGRPRRLNIRSTEVSQSLLSVIDMVKMGHTVVFDESRSFAYHKETGEEIEFERTATGWDLELEIEAPDKANEVAKQYALAAMHDNTAASQNKNSGQKSVSVVVAQSSADAFENRLDGPFRRPFR